jgi:L-lysine 2,3-aminomutase
MQKDWQTLLKEALTSPAELILKLDLDPKLIPAAEQAAQHFPLRIPRGFLTRIKKGDPNDPLLRQILPLSLEQQQSVGYSHDPLEEQASNPCPGLLHKYTGRVLVTLTSACAIHCRYCFRRYFPYANNRAGGAAWQAILDYIQADTTIEEVIFSGGDPLLAQDAYWQRCLDDLAQIAHVQILRIHTRTPIVLPERITAEFIKVLTSTRFQVVMVFHINHAQELDSSVISAVQRLRQTDITLLNQAVLLRGVNDQAAVLIELSQALFRCGILPYYLHQLDKVQGTEHFAVDKEKARHLVTTLQESLPGYLVPKFVYEKAGARSKQLVF